MSVIPPTLSIVLEPGVLASYGLTLFFWCTSLGNEPAGLDLVGEGFQTKGRRCGRRSRQSGGSVGSGELKEQHVGHRTHRKN